MATRVGESEKRMAEALRSIRASTSWFASVAGQVSRDDAVEAVRGVLVALSKVQDIIDE